MNRFPREFHAEKIRLEAYLEKAGLRLSSRREVVFEVVMRTHGHFTAEELLRDCKRKTSKVSRATVYRSIQELLEAGIIRETAFGDKHHHFEHVYDEKLHHHAQCIRCRRFIEFPDLKEDKIYRPFLECQGFEILGHEMHFYGICKKCKNKKT